MIIVDRCVNSGLCGEAEWELKSSSPVASVLELTVRWVQAAHLSVEVVMYGREPILSIVILDSLVC